MIVRVVEVTVKPGFYQQFERATGDNHHASLQEPGVSRFDVLRDEGSPGRYILYEAYRDAEAVQAHKETDHYHRWRDTAEPMMDKPRRGADCTVLYPESGSV